jgi:hypothetical protein
MEPVVDAVGRDVDGFGALPAGAAALVASAFALARELDGRSSATSKSMCARALAETMDRLRELSARSSAVSPLDEIRARRDERLRSVG